MDMTPMQNSRFLRLFFTFMVLTFSAACSGQDQKSDLKKLLKTFYEEFVLIQPGQGNFGTTYKATHPTTKKEIEIKFSKPFYVAKYEVTQNLWREVMGSNPSRWKGERNSVEMMDFDEAVEFCQKVTKLLREEKLISAKQLVRLPSEIEWEYVASAGTTTGYSFGNDASLLDDYAWYTGNAKGNDPPVGAKKPNPWGLYDIHGYLWEFTIDSFGGERPVGQLPADAWPPKKANSILKSGSWKDPAVKLKTRYRLKIDKSVQDDAVGLRCVLTR